MGYIVEDLAFKNEEKFQKNAKALALRNEVLDIIRPDVREKLESIELTEEDMNIDCIEDKFSPISEPKESYFQIPEGTNVTFIGCEEDIPLAAPLLEATNLGIDCEWRPSLVKFNKTSIALLQIGDKKDVFLIDMVALKESEALDELLTKVFRNDNTNIIGMSIHNDFRELAKGAPKQQFFKRIENLYDVQPMFAGLYNESKGMGLSKIVDKIIGVKVCKVEQMANWEGRPLRLSQQHYAASDAYILVELFERMCQYAEDHGENIKDYCHTYVAGQTSFKDINSSAQDSQL